MCTFRWNVSYQDHVGFKVSGHRVVREVEKYNASPSMIEHMRKQFNHNGDPTSFERNVLSRQGDVAITGAEWTGTDKYWQTRRWSPEFYAEFVRDLREKHEDEWKAIRAMWDRCGVPHEERPILSIPRPVYWSEKDNRFMTEPWFESAQLAA